MSSRVVSCLGLSALVLAYAGAAAAQEAPPPAPQAPVLVAQAPPIYVAPPQAPPPVVVAPTPPVVVTPAPAPVVVAPVAPAPVVVTPAAPAYAPGYAPGYGPGPGPGPGPGGYYPGDYYPRRTWGIGTVFGAGVTGGTIGTAIADPIQPDTVLSSGAGPSILLPTLELSFFLRRGHSINISIPVVNSVVVSAQVGAFYFGSDFFYNFNIGHGQVRLLLGPGLGYNLLIGGGFQMGGIRIPGEIGVEFLTRSRRFGFKIMGRPWLEFDFGTNGSMSGGSVGGGVLGLLGFSFYGVR